MIIGLDVSCSESARSRRALSLINGWGIAGLNLDGVSDQDDSRLTSDGIVASAQLVHELFGLNLAPVGAHVR